MMVLNDCPTPALVNVRNVYLKEFVIRTMSAAVPLLPSTIPESDAFCSILLGLTCPLGGANMGTEESKEVA